MVDLGVISISKVITGLDRESAHSLLGGWLKKINIIIIMTINGQIIN